MLEGCNLEACGKLRWFSFRWGGNTLGSGGTDKVSVSPAHVSGVPELNLGLRWG